MQPDVYDCMLLLYLFACVRRIALSHVRFNLVVAVYVNKLLLLQQLLLGLLLLC